MAWHMSPAAALRVGSLQTRQQLSWIWVVRLALATAAALPEEPGVVHVPPQGAVLPEATTVHSSGGALRTALVLEPVRVEGSGISLTTRVFNGSLPGPTLAVNAGDVLSILFVNGLQAPSGPYAKNSYHQPNITNLHVHGLHVSPRSPGDDVLGVNLRHGESFQYEYHILHDHSPGTYWVHPHHHGSAVLQSGAGAAGALLVLDPPGFLSPQLAALRERVLLLQELPRAVLQKAARISEDQLFRLRHLHGDEDLWLVNGALQPEVLMQPGEWQRLRLIAAGVSRWLYLDFGICEMALLAKDGIYISDFPRFVRRVSLPQGGRTDLVVRCPAGRGGEGREHEVASLAPEVGRGAKSFVGPLFRLRVQGPAAQGLQTGELQNWAPPSRPTYLQDTRSAVPACSCATSLGFGVHTRWMEGHRWSGAAAYTHVSPADAIVERRLSGLAKHQYHAHVYPFQLLETPIGDDPYFRGGDWHDTYFNVRDSQATVRYATVDFTGPQLVHCHNPAHSDQGMIAVELVGSALGAQGPGHCGCDLLALPELPGADGGSGAEYSQALIAMALGVFVAMSSLVAGSSVLIFLACRHAGNTQQNYQALAKGPVQSQEGAGPACEGA